VDTIAKRVVFRVMLIALSNVNGILAINTIREDLFACFEDDNDTLELGKMFVIRSRQ
jgi:uncharacterized alkaline shock family protein YloU